MQRRLLFAVLVIVFLVAAPPLLLGGGASAKTPPQPPGGFVDAIRFFQQPNQAQALVDLKSGAMDVYTFPLRSVADIAAAHSDPALRTADTYGFENDLFVNPVPVDQNQAPGVFNPFAIREVRQGLNYVIDRDYLNTNLFGGAGLPHAVTWNDASPEVVRDPFFFRDTNRGAGFDFDRGKTIISNALIAAGATYDGTWKWQGNPIVIPIVIRIDDFRRPLGDYVANQVESLGFSVNRRYMSAGGAFQTVYFGPPDTGAWMLYTEAWFSFLEVQRWPDSDLDFYNCGGEGSAIWSFYSPPPELRDVCSRLLFGRYASESERQALVEQGTALSLGESVRVWLVGSSTQPYSSRVTAIASDSQGGLFSPFSLRTARFASPGGTLAVGQRVQFISTFQPWQGFGFVYDAVIGQTFMDQGLSTHPRTGAFIPVRSVFETTTAGPSGTMAVPPDALTWDPSTMGFTTVPAGTTSMSKVRFHYTFGTWHDGVAGNMADVLYQIALIARRDRGDVSTHDFDAVNFHDRLFANLFRGLKVIDPTTLDLYIDYWHVDPSFIASAADVWPATPWEVGELAMATTLHDHTRVSELTAAFDGLDAIDLAKGPAVEFMDREISSGNITTRGPSVTKPPGFESYVTQSEAEARWTALQSWRTAHGHYFVSNGPYFLDSVDPAASQATVRNFAGYPFPRDRWEALLNPPVPNLAIDPIDDVQQGDEASVSMFTRVNGKLFDDATVHFRIQAVGSPDTLLSGIPDHVGKGEWQADLSADFTRNLAPGTYSFQAASSANANFVVAFADRTFRIVSANNAMSPMFVTSIESAPTPSAAPIQLGAAAWDDRGSARISISFRGSG